MMVAKLGKGAALAALLMMAGPVNAQEWDTIDAQAAREWSKGNLGRAIAMWVQSADQYGSVQAMYNLGQAYRLGKGVPKDLRISTEYFRRAANAGFVRAEEQLGLIYYGEASTRDQAFVYLQRAADKGAPRANYVLGIASLRGDGLTQDNGKAVYYLERAQGLKEAEQPLREARKNLELASLKTQVIAGPNPNTRACVGASGGGSPCNLTKPSSLALSGEVAKVVVPPKTRSRDRNGDVIAGAAAVTIQSTNAPAAVGEGQAWSVSLGRFESMPVANVKWLRISHRHNLLNHGPMIVEDGGKFRLSFGRFQSEQEAKSLCDGLMRKKTECAVLGGN